MAKRIIIDTDPGVDDAMAIILALRSPELKVEAITTVNGNACIGQATENALRILEILRIPKPPPVARGADGPLERKPFASLAIHGHDALGGVSSLKSSAGKDKYPPPSIDVVDKFAPVYICELAAKKPGKLALVALGPLTNVAIALTIDPKLRHNLKEIIVMGGACTVPGNQTPAAEFNFFCDPEAAQEVLASGIPITLVGLDVTMQARLSRQALLAATKKRTRLNRFLRDATGHVMDFYLDRQGYHGCCVHDALAMMVAIDKGFVGTKRAHVQVETQGALTAGMSVADLRPYARGHVGKPNADIALYVDPARFEQFLLDRITDG
jgi:purine nucleosidase/pyrimidine-specific ribonucleoside hydrolase